MKKNAMKRLLGLMLALVLLTTSALAAYPAETGELEADYAGKTVILHTNDVHGEISGYAKAAALKAELEARGAEVLLVDAGDFSQGDPYVDRSCGLDAVALMNAAGYDLAAVGNHEFDYGLDRLLENIEKADFPVVSANVTRNGEGVFAPGALFRLESGLVIGFLGLTSPETATSASPLAVKGLSFLGREAFMACAQEEINALRAQGADLVIALAHLGVDDLGPACPLSFELYAEVTGLDFVLDAHSHTVMSAGESGEPIQSTGTEFQYIGVVVVDNAAKRIEANFLLPVRDLPGDAAVEALETAVKERVDAELQVPIAVSEVELEGAKQVNRTQASNNGDLTTDAMLWYWRFSGEELAVPEDHVVALVNGGSIRAALGPGEVTQKDVMAVHPFGNSVCTVYVTGAQLLEALEASTYCTPEPLTAYPHTAGLTWTLDLSKEFDAGELYPGSGFAAPRTVNRVSIRNVNGEPFSLTDTYAVLTSDFTASGGDSYAVFAACERRDLHVLIDEAVTAYIRDGLGGVVSAERYGEARGDVRQIRRVSDVFADVPAEAWYTGELQSVYAAGLLSGRRETEFAPGAALTRAEAVTLLWRLAGTPASDARLPYGDVPESAWYVPALRWAWENGLAPETWGDSFGAGTPCTREELAALLYGELQREGFGFRGMWMFLLDAQDREEISDWAYEAICWLSMNGILRGVSDRVLAPGEKVTRAQAAAILARTEEVRAAA